MRRLRKHSHLLSLPPFLLLLLSLWNFRQPKIRSLAARWSKSGALVVKGCVCAEKPCDRRAYFACFEFYKFMKHWYEMLHKYLHHVFILTHSGARFLFLSLFFSIQSMHRSSFARSIVSFVAKLMDGIDDEDDDIVSQLCRRCRRSAFSIVFCGNVDARMPFVCHRCSYDDGTHTSE